MQIEVKHNCPLNNFEPCKQMDCAWFIKVVGNDANTGKQIDEYGCSIAWLPMLMIENSQQQRSTGAAIESFRNEMVKSNHTSQIALFEIAQSGSEKIKTIGDFK